MDRLMARAAILLCLGLLLGAASKAEEAYPIRPIRVVVPFAPGSGTDNTARHFTRRISEKTGWSFIIDNKPGGNGFIGISDFLRSASDGYTIVFTGGTTHGVNSALFKKLPYDPAGDFMPISPSVFAPMVLMARPSLKVESASELLAYIRQNPGKVSVATGSSFQQLASEIFKHEAKLDIQLVSYKGSAQSMTDLIGGFVDMTFVDLIAGMPQIRAGVLKPLAVTSAKRVAALPSVPTMAEAGLPDIRLNNWAGLFVKKGTSPAIAAKLAEVFSDYFKSAEYQAFIGEAGSFYEPMSPDQMNVFVKNEIRRATETFRRAGIQPE